MTWKEFNDAVRKYLVGHNRRHGIQDLIDQLILVGVWELEETVPFYRRPFTRTFTGSSLREFGYAATATLPAGAKVEDVYAHAEDDTNDRTKFKILTTLTELQEIESGVAPSGVPYFYFDAETGRFYVAPKPEDNGMTVKVQLSGEKFDYEDTDDVVLDEKAAEAVGNFVNMRLSLQVDNDSQRAATFRSLWISSKRRLRSATNPALLVPKDA